MASKKAIARAVDQHLAAATRAGRERRRSGSLALSATYRPRERRLHIELASGLAVAIPVAMIQGLAEAPARVIKQVEIIGKGYALYWANLDLDLSVQDLLRGRFGTKAWMIRLGKTPTFEALAAELRQLTKGRKHTPAERLLRRSRDER